MAVTPKKIIAGSELTGSAATYYTAPANTRVIIKKLTFTNKHATDAINVTVYLIPSGGAAGDNNTLVDAKAVGPKECWECTQAEGHVLEAAGFIQALASTAAEVTIQGSGVEIT